MPNLRLTTPAVFLSALAFITITTAPLSPTPASAATPACTVTSHLVVPVLPAPASYTRPGLQDELTQVSKFSVDLSKTLAATDVAALRVPPSSRKLLHEAATSLQGAVTSLKQALVPALSLLADPQDPSAITALSNDLITLQRDLGAAGAYLSVATAQVCK
jgi:hypothetical protein